MSDARPPSDRPTDPGRTAAAPAAKESGRGRAFDSIPRVFGRYRILDCLGRGGMGAVFRATDTELDRTVALKVPFLSTDDPELKQRFYREARAAATLHHPNICPVFDVGELNGIPYLTMAFIEGRTLSQAIEAGQSFAPQQVGLLVRKLALAMQEAHTHGVIHRDLKPANVVLRPNGEPVIMDFGLARRGDDRRSEGLTRQGEIIGTLEYMSPEQLDGDNAAVGPSSDVYALGVVMYELMTGRRPFTGTTTSMMVSIMLKPPPAPSEIRPGLPTRLEEICLTAMAKKPAERFPSMRQFAAALTEYLKSQQSGAVPGPAVRSAPAAPTPPPEAHTRPIPDKDPVASKPAAEGESIPVTRSSRRRPKSTTKRKKPKPPPNRTYLYAGVGVAAFVVLVAGVLAARSHGDRAATAQGPSHAPTTAPQPGPTSDRSPEPPPAGRLATTPATTSKAPPPSTKKSTPPPSAPAAPPVPLGIAGRTDAESFAVGETYQVKLRVERHGYQGPVELRWTGTKDMRITPAGPLTVRPGTPEPVVSIRLLAEPSGEEPRLDVTATPTQQPERGAGQYRLAFKVKPGPCVRVVDLGERGGSETSAVAFDPNATLALVGGGGHKSDGGKAPAGQGGDESSVQVWNLTSGEMLKPLPVHGRVTELLVSADGKTALVASGDGSVALWDLTLGRREAESPRNAPRILAAAMSPDAKRGLAVYPGVLVKINMDRFASYGSPTKTAQLTGNAMDNAVRAVAVSDEHKGLVGGVEGKLFLIDMNDRAKPKALGGHREAVLCATFAPGGKLAASGGGGILQVGSIQPGRENAVCVWDVAGAALKWKAEAKHARPVVDVAFSADGRLLASGSEDGDIRVWEVEGGSQLAAFPGHTGRILGMAFTADGKGLWSGSADKTLRQWRLP